MAAPPIEPRDSPAHQAAPEPSSPAMPLRRLSPGKRVAFSLVTILLAWFLLETSTFFLYWLAMGRPFSWTQAQEDRRETISRLASVRHSVVAQVHPYVGYVEEPGRDSNVKAFGSTKSVPISPFGYLDDKPPIQKRSADRVIVGITGGSVAALFAINGTRRLEQLLQAAPEFAGKKFVFLNLALGGYKQPQQLMTLSYLLSLGAEFDIVLNIDGFNEIALYEFENEKQGLFPAFPRSWYARIQVVDAELARMMGRVEDEAEKRLALARSFSRAPWCYSVVANVVGMFLDRRIDWRIYRIRESFFQGGPKGSRYVITGPPKGFTTKEELYEKLVALWSNSSIQMNNLCKGNGIRYEHFLQPDQYLPGSKPMGPEEAKIAILPKHAYRTAVERGYPLLIARGKELKERGVPFHDLTQLFANHPEPIYIDNCCHYNQEGYDLMAEAIADVLLKETDQPVTSRPATD